MRDKPGIYGYLAVLACALLTLSCATSDAFRDKLRAMDDDELTAYYHGINDRIKDLDHQDRLGRRSDNTRFDQTLEQSHYVLDGQSMDLIGKEKMIRREMDRRNLSTTPHPL